METKTNMLAEWCKFMGYAGGTIHQYNAWIKDASLEETRKFFDALPDRTEFSDTHNFDHLLSMLLDTKKEIKNNPKINSIKIARFKKYING